MGSFGVFDGAFWAMINLTPRQAEVLGFVKAYAKENGCPPSRLDISSEFGWSSPNAAECHLRALAKKGEIFLTPGIARGIRIA